MVDFNKFKSKRKNRKTSFSLIELSIIVLAFSIIFSIITGIVVYKISTKKIKTDTPVKDIVKSYNNIIDDYYGEVDRKELSEAAINGMMNYLNEKYSTYMNDEDTSNLTEKLSGTYRGIGIELLKRENVFLIVNVFDGTPAKDSGLKSGDIILKINNTNVDNNMTTTDISTIIGDSDSVKIIVKRNNKEYTYNIKIKTIDYPVVMSNIYERNNKKVGYIYLSSFSKNAAKQVKAALKELEKEGIDSLIFDVRSNTGGYLQSCNDILELFLKKNKVMYYLDYKEAKEEIKSTTNEERNYEIVVLINGTTASASEILAASLKESYGAILIGTKTFGKGMVQSTSKLSNNSMIKYSTAKWYTPNGDFIDEIGINPGITVKMDSKYKEEPIDINDSQLQKALEILSN